MANAVRKTENWFQNEDSGRRVPVERRPTGSNLPSLPASYFGPISNFFWDMDRMFDRAFRSFGVPTTLAGMPSWGVSMFQPSVDITSNENEYTITAEVPGLEEKDIKLDVSADGILTISGEKRQENVENRKDIHCTECSYGAFTRTLSLPDDADSDNIKARFRNGILTITCPRTESVRQSRRQIPISGGSKATEGSRGSNMNERSATRQESEKAA